MIFKSTPLTTLQINVLQISQLSDVTSRRSIQRTLVYSLHFHFEIILFKASFSNNLSGITRRYVESLNDKRFKPMWNRFFLQTERQITGIY